MKHPSARASAHPILALVLAGGAMGQIHLEDFEGGNPDAWELWFSPYNSLVSSGGNPGTFLQLDNVTSGPATCHFVEIFPDRSGTPLAHSGDWRAAGIGQVEIDLDVQQGLFDGDLTLRLISDPGTPSTAADDCEVRMTLFGAGPSGPGWERFTFTVPTNLTTLPPGWEVPSGTVCSANPAAAWDTVVQDVDRIEFEYRANLPSFCTFTSWILGVDNVRVSGGSSEPGANYCSAAANSTGAPALMSAVGSRAAADNDLTLTCDTMPATAFGFFLTSQTQAFVPNPGGSAGNLCLGGSIGRYVGPGQIQNSGPSGTISLVLDLAAVPTPTGFVAAQPGETWNFTAWFRDAGPAGATSNFADGYEVGFL